MAKTAKKTAKKAAKKVAKKAAPKKAAKKAAPKKAAKKAAPKKAAKKAKRTPNAAFMAPVTPSASLAAVIGNKPVPRTVIVKKIWDYIKKNGLQDKNNKRMLNADEKLKPVFGKAQISMFDLAGIIGKHVKA
jgi:chromatin remodeling complex protein RSC6